MMAVWRRQPKQTDGAFRPGQSIQQLRLADFLKAHNLQCRRRRSRRGNCHDNAVAESFFQLLKRERMRRKAETRKMQSEISLITLRCSQSETLICSFSKAAIAPMNYRKAVFRTAGECLGNSWRFSQHDKEK